MKSLFSLFLFVTLPLLAKIVPCPLPEDISDVQTVVEQSGITTISVHDAKRDKTFETVIWYPVQESRSGSPARLWWERSNELVDAPMIYSDSKAPLIVVSHGWGSNPYEISWLAEILAANGFVVAVPQHADFLEPGRLFHMEHWNRALDVSAVINQLLVSTMKDRIDPAKIGVVGYSLGGTTAVWLMGARATKLGEAMPQGAGPQMFAELNEKLVKVTDLEPGKLDYGDKRIKAAFLLAPANGWYFPVQELEKIQTPTAIVVGESDQWTPLKNNAQYLADHLPQGCLTVLGAPINHATFMTPIKDEMKGRLRSVQEFLYSDPPGVDRRAVQRYVGALAVLFFQDTLEE